MLHTGPSEPWQPDTVLRPHEWQQQAACRRPDVDPDWWQADSTTHEAKLARDWCNQACPVRERCLTEALKAEAGKSYAYRAGTLGGLSAYSRNLLDKRQRAAAKAAA